MIDPETKAATISANPIMRYFEYEHLPEKLRQISQQFSQIAWYTIEVVPPSAERTAGLRKILEAKDCIVRAGL